MAEFKIGTVGASTDGQRRYVVVAEEILAAIGAGRLSPGDRLPNERELAQLCRASRPTVRDALLALELFGVVEVRRGSGCYVTEAGANRRGMPATTLDAVPRELLEARLYIEPTVSRLCARQLDPSALERLSTLIDACEATEEEAADGNLVPFLELSHRFHAEFARSCGNQILAGITTSLVDVVAHPLWSLVNAMHLRTTEARRGQLQEHREVLTAVAARDADAAFSAMSSHLQGLYGGIFGRDGRPESAAIARQRRRSR